MCEHISFVVVADQVLHYDKLKSHEEILNRAGLHSEVLCKVAPIRSAIIIASYSQAEAEDFMAPEDLQTVKHPVHRPEWDPTTREIEWDILRIGFNKAPWISDSVTQTSRDAAQGYVNDHWNTPSKIAKWVERNWPTCAAEMYRLLQRGIALDQFLTSAERNLPTCLPWQAISVDDMSPNGRQGGLGFGVPVQKLPNFLFRSRSLDGAMSALREMCGSRMEIHPSKGHSSLIAYDPEQTQNRVGNWQHLWKKPRNRIEIWRN